jgi:hypothetical protein
MFIKTNLRTFLGDHVVRTFLSLSLAIVFSSTNIFGQDVLTNGAVVEMVKSGLSTEIIVAKIQSSTVAFDTSAQALKLLSDAGVPDKVVISMITEAGKVSKDSARTAKENDKLLSSVPEQGKLKDLLTKKRVFLATQDLKARDIIEKELSKIKKFVFVDRIEESDFIVTYESWIETVNVSATVVGNTATARENTELIGLFTVKMFSDSTESGRVRLIYSARKSKYFIWDSNPAESTTKQFIKDLTKAAAAAGTNP